MVVKTFYVISLKWVDVSVYEGITFQLLSVTISGSVSIRIPSLLGGLTIVCGTKNQFNLQIGEPIKSATVQSALINWHFATLTFTFYTHTYMWNFKCRLFSDLFLVGFNESKQNIWYSCSWRHWCFHKDHPTRRESGGLEKWRKIKFVAFSLFHMPKQMMLGLKPY